jgi:hypothetical protein
VKNPSPVTSTLDSVLQQSLAAVMRTRSLDNDVLSHVLAALTRIARFYRTTVDVVSQTVIEPAAVAIDVDGHALRCPRLLVQCTRRDTVVPCPLTFIYTPTHQDRIALTIAYDACLCEAPHTIQWIGSKNDWCIAGHESELDGRAHASFVRNALCQGGLFSSQAMSLEPLTP